jgi:hypothetical protein
MHIVEVKVKFNWCPSSLCQFQHNLPEGLLGPTLKDVTETLGKSLFCKVLVVLFLKLAERNLLLVARLHHLIYY